MDRLNILIVVILGTIAGYALYLQNNELAAACAGALSTALTGVLRGNHEPSKEAVDAQK